MCFFCTQFHLSLHAKKKLTEKKSFADFVCSGGGCCCRCYTRIQFIHVLLLWGANQLNKKSVTKASRSMNLNHFWIKLKCNFFESKYWKTKHTMQHQQQQQILAYSCPCVPPQQKRQLLTRRVHRNFSYFNLRKEKKTATDVKFNSGRIMILFYHRTFNLNIGSERNAALLTHLLASLGAIISRLDFKYFSTFSLILIYSHKRTLRF